MSLDQEYDAQHSRSILDTLDTDDGVKSPQLQGSYPPQLDDRHDDFYQQPQGMHPGHQQQSGQAQYEQGQIINPTSHPSAADGGFDPNDAMLDADPFNLSASMRESSRSTYTY